MGASSDLFLFNHGVLVDCVAPAVLRLLHTGALGPWLTLNWEERFARCHPSVRRPFRYSPAASAARETIGIGADLSGSAENPPIAPWVITEDCERDDMQMLVERMICRYCQGDCWHLGRTVYIVSHWEGYDEMTEHWHPRANRIRELIQHLFRCGRPWTHGSGGCTEGIHGWLSPEETLELAVEMEDLPLPRCEPTHEALTQWIEENHNSPLYDYEGEYTRSMTYLRTLAGLAALRNDGLLLGNDIYPAEWRIPPREMSSHWLAWRDGMLPRMAQAIHAEHSFGDLPVLADALEEAGCDQQDMIIHCRENLAHRKTCWVLELLMRSKLAEA